MRRLRGWRDICRGVVIKGNILSGLELKGLKGLRSLGILIEESESTEIVKEVLDRIALDFLIPGKYQPRQNIDQQTLMELAESIKTQGILQPLIVRKVENHKYEIIAGERRWRAAKLAGLTHVPALIKAVEDNVALAYALIENIQRENLNAIEEAVAFERFKNEFDMTHSDIAQTVGRSRASITNSLRLLTLCDQVKKLLEEGRLDMGHARALLSLTTEQQIEAAKLVVEKALSVRETEKLVQRLNNIPEKKKTTYIDEAFEKKSAFWKTELSKKLSSSVNIQVGSDGKGKMVIHFDSMEEANWLMDHVGFTEKVEVE